MARGKSHDPETKAAVMAALVAGQGVNEVARQYKLDSGLVSRWKARIPKEQLQQVAAEKGAQIEGLLFDYLSANLTALKAQANVAADEGYLKRYPPQQIAVLHGVMADKAVRLLEALNSQDGAEATGEESEHATAAD